MIAKRIISILVLSVWVFTQTTMLFAHTVSDNHGAQMQAGTSSHSHAHAGHEADMSGVVDDVHDDTNTSHPDMSGMECCGNTCTVDASVLTCPIGSDRIIRAFNGAKAVALTATELGSPNPPPNTTF